MNPTVPAERTPARELARDLGVSHAGAIVVGTIIGSGIFLVPQEMMQAVGSAPLVYLAWIVGGLLSFFGVLTYAELAALKPQAGGEYVYVRDGYGPLAGFLYAWTWCFIAKPASIASITTALVRILGTFSVFAFLSHSISNQSPLTWGQIFAIVATLLITLLNYLGVKKAGDFQLVFTFLKIAMILVIVAVGFSYGHGALAHFHEEFTGAKGGFAGFMAALVAALWAYDGWNDLTMVSGEVKNPERNLPRALIFGVGTVAALYLSVNAAIQYVLPAAAIAASPRPASDAVSLVIGPAGAGLVAAGMALSMLVTLNGTIMSGARVPFAVARDGYFFPALGQVHARFRTPAVALAVQAGLAILLLLLGGSFRQFFSLAIFAEWLFYMIAASTIFIFRRSKVTQSTYRTWGYPVVPALFILASAVLLYYTFTENLRYSIWGTLLILAGIPVFYAFSSLRSRQPNAR
jgi:basic amino acid/polyamine antiporter, APA family